MYPFIHIGPLSIGTFGLMLWLAAVCACWVLHKNFVRWGISADAIGIVAVSTVAGIVGAKLWHVLESPHVFFAAPFDLLFDRSGFAWFGGLLAGILALMWQGRIYKIRPLAMLDFAAARSSSRLRGRAVGMPHVRGRRLRNPDYSPVGHEFPQRTGAHNTTRSPHADL